MQDLIEYIDPRLFILVVFIWGLGLFLKLYPKFKAEYLIPTILLLVSMTFTILWMAIMLDGGFTAKVMLSGIVQGLLIASLAVFGNEQIKQLMRRRKDD